MCQTEGSQLGGAQGRGRARLTARRTVSEVDELRVGFLTRLYEGTGLDAGLARNIARIEYAAFVGAQIIWPDMAKGERRALEQRFAALVSAATGALPQPD